MAEIGGNSKKVFVFLHFYSKSRHLAIPKQHPCNTSSQLLLILFKSKEEYDQIQNTSTQNDPIGHFGAFEHES